MKYVIGVDIGGTNIKIGAVTLGGEIISYTTKKSKIFKDKKSAIKNLTQSVESIRKSLVKDALIGVGIGIAGTVLADKGIVSQSPNMPQLDGLDLKKELSKNISYPFFIDNDANVFAIGEGWLGNAKGYKNFCCITLGTGVGGGIVIDGRVLRGFDGTAGEVGHIIVEPRGVPCKCGGRGCLEAYASLTGLIRMAAEGFKTEKAKGLRESCNNNVRNISPEIIAKLARKGDSFCKGLFEKLGYYLGIAMTDLINLLNIELIVIGGGLSKANDLFLETAKNEAQKRSLKVPGKRVKVVTACCEEAGGVFGAAYMALKGVGVI